MTMIQNNSSYYKQCFEVKIRVKQQGVASKVSVSDNDCHGATWGSAAHHGSPYGLCVVWCWEESFTWV